MRHLQAAYTVNQQRTLDQDAGYGIQQIVDVALRALSPGVNDTTTAVMSVNYLTAILVRLALRRIASPRRYVDGQLRVIARGPTFATLLATALDQICRNAAGNVTVLACLLQAVETVAGVTTSYRRRQALWQQVQRLEEVIHQSIVLPEERQALTNQSRHLGQLLAPPGAAYQRSPEECTLAADRKHHESAIDPHHGHNSCPVHAIFPGQTSPWRWRIGQEPPCLPQALSWCAVMSGAASACRMAHILQT